MGRGQFFGTKISFCEIFLATIFFTSFRGNSKCFIFLARFSFGRRRFDAFVRRLRTMFDEFFERFNFPREMFVGVFYAR